MTWLYRIPPEAIFTRIPVFAPTGGRPETWTSRILRAGIGWFALQSLRSGLSADDLIREFATGRCSTAVSPARRRSRRHRPTRPAGRMRPRPVLRRWCETPLVLHCRLLQSRTSNRQRGCIVNIQFHCDSCGKLVQAPPSAAGKRGQCPYCGKSVYIPPPEGELAELPLAPEDSADEQRQAALLAERRRLDHILEQEKAAADEDEPTAPEGASTPHAASIGPPEDDLEETVIAYLVAFSKSDLDHAESLLPVLQRHRSEVRKIIERLAADQIAPKAMAGVPSAVYQGFLKKLRGQL